MSDVHEAPSRIRNLALAERDAQFGRSVRALERELEDLPYQGQLLDLTYADTHRFPPPAWVLPDFSAAARGGGMTYTPYRGDRTVRSAVAESVSAFLGVEVDPDTELILTPGTQAALFGALASLVEQGDTVALGDPDYISDERLIRFLGARAVQVPLAWDAAGAEPELDLDVLEAAFLDGARTLLFSNPNNPTGAVLTAGNVRAIARLVVQHDVFVIVDELYSRLVYDGRAFTHLIAEEGMRERCVTLLGPSKTESMSGYRVGAAVAPREIVDRMEDLQGVSVLRAPAYAQHVMTRWLSDDHDFVAARIRDYQSLRDRTVETLNASGVVRVRPAQGTAYMFPDATAVGADTQAIALALKSKAGLLVNPGYQFGPRGHSHFRICFAQEERAWEAAMDRMVSTLRALSESSAAAASGKRSR